MEQKIVKVVRITREGVSKKTNKPYQILLVMVENGDEVEVFGPANPGDIVTDITFDQTYDQLKGRVLKQDKNAPILAEIGTKLDNIEKLVKWLVQQQRTKQTKQTKPMPDRTPLADEETPKPKPLKPTGPLKQKWDETQKARNATKSQPEDVTDQYTAEDLDGLFPEEPDESQ